MTRQPTVDGQTRLMGVIGHQIAYTRSPAMHNAAAARLGINVVYLPIDLPAAKVEGFLDVAWHMGAVGFNVTTPHKALVASLVKGHRLHSVNTLRRGAAGWEAASTDGQGFVRGLARMGRSLADFDTAVILGNGGAVSAILTQLGDRPVRILRRDAARDSELRSAQVSFDTFTPEALKRALDGAGARSLLIQATNAPQHGESLAAFVPALAGFSGAVSDLVYAKPSALVAAAHAKGLAAQDGEAMLIEQARLSQELWWGRAAGYEDMRAFLRQ